MLLKDLILGLEVKEVVGSTNIEIVDFTCDSNKVLQGFLFVALVGQNSDGHDFLFNAVSNGARAIIANKKIDTLATQIIVDDTRCALSKISSNFYNNPEKNLKIIGITGTNGKTSTSHIIAKILNENNVNCGIIGTIGTFYNGKSFNQDLTTPDPKELFKTLREMVDEKTEVVAMEVSAHALYYKKIFGIDFFAVVFTNFTQDHLDFFDNMENYKKAKTMLFFDYNSKYKVINTDDKVGRELYKKIKDPITYGLNNPSDVFAIDVVEKTNGLKFVLNLFDKIYDIDTKLNGLFNVYNILAGATVCALLKINLDDIAKSINRLSIISGRLEKIYDKDFSVYIDYAHTPDGLKKVLLSLKKICNGKLICIFGCGGNRDEDKREKMGKISGEFSDFSIITTDNPRYEDPMSIIMQIEKGVMEKTKEYVIIENRIEAIRYGLSYAKKDDFVLIAGKGSEKYQEVLGVKSPYNDSKIVKQILG